MSTHTLRFCLAALLSLTAFADTVTLKNGDRLTGKIVSFDDKELLLKTEYAGDVKIKREVITSVNSDTPLVVTLPDGKKVEGKVATAADALKVDSPQAAETKLAEVKAIRDTPSQQAFEREVERTTNPRWNDFWTTNISLSFAGASGNASTQSFGTGFRAQRATGRDKTSLYFNQIYATQSTAEPTGPTANRLSGGARYEYSFSSKIFTFGTADFDYDRFLDLDLRSVLGGGFGWHLVKNDRHTFDISAGLTWNREKFTVPGATPPAASSLVRNSGEFLIGEESTHKVGKLKLFQRFYGYPNLTNTGEFRAAFDAGAALPIFKFLEWNVAFNDRYLSNPPLGKKKNDVLYTTGLSISFSQK
jgi:putative salt-induced outer membrane protein YdiY